MEHQRQIIPGKVTLTSKLRRSPDRAPRSFPYRELIQAALEGHDLGEAPADATTDLPIVR